MRTRRRLGRSGQAATEFALLVPLLVLLALGTYDLGKAWRYAIAVTNESRGGARVAIIDQHSDIGDSVRTEPSSIFDNNTTNWGVFAAGGTSADCIGAGIGTCGDTSGCPPSVFTGTTVACFAVRTCSTVVSSQCLVWQGWGTRPTYPSGQMIMVRVSLKLGTFTPLIHQIVGNALIIQRDEYAYVEY